MQIEKFARASPYFVYLSMQMTLENFRKNKKKIHGQKILK